MAEELCPNCGAPFTGAKCEYCGTPRPAHNRPHVQTEDFTIAHPQFFDTTYNFSTHAHLYRLSFNAPVCSNKWCRIGCTLRSDSLGQEIKFPDFLRHHTADGITYETIDLDAFQSICHASNLDDVCVTAALTHLDNKERARLHSFYRGLHEAIYGTGEFIEDLHLLQNERNRAESLQCAEYAAEIKATIADRDKTMKCYDWCLISFMTIAFICNEIMIFGTTGTGGGIGVIWILFVLLSIGTYLFKSASKSTYKAKFSEIAANIEALAYADDNTKAQAIRQATAAMNPTAGCLVPIFFILYIATILFSAIHS